MASTEERLKVLKLIQEGKITPEEGNALLEALEIPMGKDKASSQQENKPPESGKGARWLHVRVTDTDTGKIRVNVRLPVNLVNAGVKMGARFSPEVQGIDMDTLLQYIRSGKTGQIVDLYDAEDGEHVEVFIE